MYPLLFISSQFGDPDSVPPPSDPGQLPAPYSYDIATAGTTQLNHSWTAVPSASGYELEQWNGAAFVNIASPSGTSYNHTGINAYTMYYYRFRAKGDGVTYTDSDWVYRNQLTDDTKTPFEIVIDDWLTLSGATSPQITAVRTFAAAAVTHGYAYNLIALYIFAVGSSLTNKLFNALDPEDLDEAMRAEVLTAVSSHAKGIQITSANTLALNLNVLPDDIIDTPKIGFAWYTQTATNQFLYNNNAQLNLIHYSPGDTKSYPNIGKSSSGTPFSGTNEAGLTLVQRPDLNTVKVYQNGTLKATDTQVIDPITDPASPAHYFDATEPVRIFSSHASAVCSFLACFRAMDDTKRAFFESDIATLMTSLGVNV